MGEGGGDYAAFRGRHNNIVPFVAADLAGFAGIKMILAGAPFFYFTSPGKAEPFGSGLVSL